MADLKTISIAKIFVPERLRAVEEDQALAISASIVEHGLINPITVRQTPRRSETPYTLVAGAHRLRAMELIEEGDIDCVIVDGDAVEAQLIEITENLFRNDLSVMDRAIFIATYRDVWERKYGKIEAGRPGQNRVNLIQLMTNEAETGFSQHVADRLGLSVPSVKRLNRISLGIPARLREKLRGTPAADNQARLLTIAKLSPKQKAALLRAIDICDGDLDRALATIDDNAAARAKLTKDDKTYSTLMSTWERTNPRVQERFVEALADRERRALFELLKSKLEEAEA